MKKIALLLVMIALLAMGASALTVSSPTLGGDKQDRVSGVQTTFTITNNNTAAMTGITISPGNGAENAKYALSFSGIPSSLAAGAIATITVNGTIPLDYAGIDSVDLKAKALKIGTMTVSGTVGSVTDSASADIKMQAVNQLDIRKVRIDCGRKSETIDDGDKVDNLKPGDSCTLEIEVENKFSDRDTNNKKIGDIDFTSVSVSIDSPDNDVDIDEDSDIDDLDADDKDSVTADLDIEDDAKDGAIKIEIRITAKDSNGALHGEGLDFRLEVDRLTHDIQIRRIELSPTLVSNCQASTAKVNVNILNQGKRDEDEAAVEVSVTELKFSQKRENIEIDEDDRTSVSFDIPIAKGTPEGVVRVGVTTFFDSFAQSNSGSVDLTIEGCESEEPKVADKPADEEKQSTTVTPQTNVQPVTPQPGQALAAPKKSESFTDSKAYVALLVVLIVVLLGGIGAMAAMLMRAKKQY